MPKALTVKSIDAQRASISRLEVPDGGLVGLYLVVQPSGSKSWAVRYRHAGRPRKMKIGDYLLFGLADARKAASAALRSVAEGRDPSQDRADAAKAKKPDVVTVEQAFDEFMRRHSELRNRPSTVRENRRYIGRELIPRFGKHDIRDVGRADIVGMLDDLMDRELPQSANRVHALSRKAFNWFVERGILERSPCAHVRAPAESVARDRVLSLSELSSIWSACNAVGWPFGPFVQLLILTGQRRDEVASARWSEFNFAVQIPTWTIPKERSKNKTANTIWLAPPAIQILQDLPKVANSTGEVEFVFTTTGNSPVSGFSGGKERIEGAIGKVRDTASANLSRQNEGIMPWRFHDLRRTVASGMGALSVEQHVIDKVLNHQNGVIRGVAAIYNRHDYADLRQRAFLDWAKFLHTKFIDVTAGNKEQP